MVCHYFNCFPVFYSPWVQIRQFFDKPLDLPGEYPAKKCPDMGFLREHLKYPMIFNWFSHLPFNAWTSVCLCLGQHQSDKTLSTELIAISYVGFILDSIPILVLDNTPNIQFAILGCHCWQILDVQVHHCWKIIGYTQNPWRRISAYQRKWGHEP